jgi:hypothetical protein
MIMKAIVRIPGLKRMRVQRCEVCVAKVPIQARHQIAQGASHENCGRPAVPVY